MIKLEYKPTEYVKSWGQAQDISTNAISVVQELNMTLRGDVTWTEATREFHNFLRGAGYVIPYDLEWYEDSKDEDDIDKSGSLGDRQHGRGNWMSDEFDHRDSLQKLTD